LPLVVAVLVHVPEEFDTSAHKLVDPVRLPEVPVTLIVYAPRVVPEAVVTVSVDVSAVVPVIDTEVELRLQLGLVAFEIEVVTAQVSETVPVNEFAGVTVIVEVPVELWATEILPLLVSVKLLLLSGACQKLAQPANMGAAANKSLAQLPIFMHTPSKQFSCPDVVSNTLSGYPSYAHPVLPPATRQAHTCPALCL
jgi:hypothetical protein